VAVEPIAARLGATKGSFYWHFKDRESLVRAALDLWEEQQTDGVIGGLASLEGPAERLDALIDLVLTSPGHAEDPVVGLLRDVHHPAVAAALERVTRRRVEYIATQVTELGMPQAEAVRRSAVAYAAYVGWWQLRALVPMSCPPATRRGRTPRCSGGFFAPTSDRQGPGLPSGPWAVGRGPLRLVMQRRPQRGGFREVRAAPGDHLHRRPARYRPTPARAADPPPRRHQTR
jgi:AcrR family transcriptional regulator